MSEQMDFNDGKYTVISDNGRLTALRNGEPWNRDITGDSLIYWMLVEAIRLKEERDASAAKLAKVEVAGKWNQNGNPFIARPVPAEPVNARLLSLAKKFEDYMHGPTAWSEAQENALSAEIYDALAAAEAQQVEPLRLTDEESETLARAHGTGGWQMLASMMAFSRAVLRKQGYKVEG